MTPRNITNAGLNSDVTHLGQRLDDHESRCEERLDGINQKFVDIKDDLKGMRRAMYSVAVALIAWLAINVWTGAMDRMSALEKTDQSRYAQQKAPG